MPLQFHRISLSSSLTEGHEFMTVTATDADDTENTDNGVISYSIVKQDPELPKPNLFTINSVTGGIRVNALGLDKEVRNDDWISHW